MGGERVLQDVHRNGQNFIEGDGKKGESLDWDVPTDKKALEGSVICLLYSSGTTGVPKGELLDQICIS
jgi:4-coumarate--CoA ligase